MFQKEFFIILLGLFSLFFLPHSFAQAKHDDILNACSACHGFDGMSKEKGTPNLWGQPEIYLQQQITAFRNTTRINPAMDAVSHELPDADITFAAQHYSRQTGSLNLPLQWRGDKWPGNMSLGEQIAFTGKLPVKIPACVSCHGPSGVGLAPFFPRLGGQDKAYLVKQLNAWKTGKRPPGTMGVMVGIAISLTAEEIDAVASYFSAQGDNQ